MKRIQRKRTKGWRMPSNAAYVGRPSRWGNPWATEGSLFFALKNHDRLGGVRGVFGFDGLFRGAPFPPRVAVADVCVLLYRYWLAKLETEHPDEFLEWLLPLAGKDLACWCPLDQPCHADPLLDAVARHFEDLRVLLTRQVVA